MSIRRLTESDRESVVELLNKDKLTNIGRINSLSLFGLDSPVYGFYGEYSGDRLVAVVSIYKSMGAGYFSEGKRDVSEAAEFLKGVEWKSLGGRKELIQQFIPLLEHKKTEESIYAVTRDYEYFNIDETSVHTMSTEEELQEIMNVIFSIEEFEKMRVLSREELISEARENYFNYKDGIMTYLRNGGRIVSIAGTSLETDEFAIVQYVTTIPDERRKGCATTMIKYLMNEYKKKGKMLCLHYSNPEAAKIYQRLGFVDFDEVMGLIR